MTLIGREKVGEDNDTERIANQMQKGEDNKGAQEKETKIGLKKESRKGR